MVFYRFPVGLSFAFPVSIGFWRNHPVRSTIPFASYLSRLWHVSCEYEACASPYVFREDIYSAVTYFSVGFIEPTSPRHLCSQINMASGLVTKENDQMSNQSCRIKTANDDQTAIYLARLEFTSERYSFMVKFLARVYR